MTSDILIKQYCKELRFGKNIYENYSKISATDYADFLAQLLKMEVDHRELVRKNRNLKSAGFDVIKTFEGYEFKDIQIPSAISIEIINDLSDLTSNEDPAKNIIKNPSTVKQMAEQIIVAADAYFSLRLEEDEFQELILNYASRHGKKLFGKNGKINPTIRNIIGKKRRELVELMLRGYQLSVF
jgi:uncharacterized protein (TIGR04540 family)